MHMSTRLTTEQWLAILQNKKITKAKQLAVLNVIYHSPNRQSRAEWIAAALGYKTHSPINLIVGHYAQKIHEANPHLHLVFDHRANGTVKWWTLLFDGWYIQETANFMWQLKPDLCVALEQSGLLNPLFPHKNQNNS